MTRARAGFLLAALFVLGLAAGSLGTAAWMARAPHRGSGFRPERVERLALRRIARRLDLDQAQRESLRQIAARSRVRMDQVRRETVARIDRILDEAYDELVPHLSPRQKAELEEMRRQARRRAHRGEERRDGPE